MGEQERDALASCHRRRFYVGVRGGNKKRATGPAGAFLFAFLKLVARSTRLPV
jgi:hypothetical protein